ncbi:amyloid beta precursor protein binding family B member 2 isoform X2 [Hydra vulgaris]|uniref:Amyloid beta precursor protein binding family B member 2 isoform X2 n=1 Tax=Hydra vulgaris TaxID=6087 RepID=A0ABM4D4G0_HYDVU
MEQNMLQEKRNAAQSVKSNQTKDYYSIIDSPINVEDTHVEHRDIWDNKAKRGKLITGPYSYVNVNIKPREKIENDMVVEPSNSVKHIEVNNDLYAIVDKTNSGSINNVINSQKLSCRKSSTNETVAIDRKNNSALSIGDVTESKPLIPKPYRSDIKNSSHDHQETVFNRVQYCPDAYRNSISTEDILVTDQSSLSKLPSYSELGNENNESHNKKSGGFSSGKQSKSEFQKTHRRMHSFEPVHKNFAENLPELNKFSTLGRDFSKTSTSTKMRKSKTSDELNSFDSLKISVLKNELNSDKLPDGWQEVKDGSETYYWHIWTGTIQYERPRACMTPNVSERFDSTQDLNQSLCSSTTNDFHISGQMSLNEDDELETGIRFPVHSMGWMDVDADKMGSNIIAETVNNCITIMEEQRYDLYQVSETWAEAKDIEIILEDKALKLYDPKSKTVLNTQPISKMRVWGVGRSEPRDFAYIARDQASGKHRCHMFRCHGELTGRSITNALQIICNRVLDEKRQTKEQIDCTKTSNLFQAPSKTSSVFNEKPYVEEKKRFTAKYVGQTAVSSSTGIDIVNKCVRELSEGKKTSDWCSVLIEVTTSEIKTIDCFKQHSILTHRVRFISFLGVAQDERFAAYILAVAKDAYACHVFFCAPHAGTLTKAIEQACKLRLEKMIQGKGYGCSNVIDSNQVPPQQDNQQVLLLSKKEKPKSFTSSMLGVFSKFNRREKKKENLLSQLSPNENEFAINYFGSCMVNIGTGIETVHKAVNTLVGGEKMSGFLQVQSDCITLSDSNYTALSKRVFDISSISFCGMASDRKHFGIIVSSSKNKYLCHVFEECKNYGSVVSAIQDVL